MQRKYITLIGVGLIAALTFGAGFKLGQNSKVLAVYTPSSSGQRVDQKSSLLATPSNWAAAILLMPKSYVPLLEKFKQRKIARAIKILPARIGWDDDQMIAVPQNAILKNSAAPDSPIANISHRSQMNPKVDNAAKSNIAQGAALFFLLKSAAQKKLRFMAYRSAAAKSGL